MSVWDVVNYFITGLAIGTIIAAVAGLAIAALLRWFP
jgi:hypothetical protein